ncbi:response regulator [Cohnella fermenti]|uniref:Response regulator n=1 Tax=Cohnella fermenti TaxID=2565925 RepID=A0A4V3WGK9_9BACL|nr:response regulator [Cohnella fermenti]THF84676.1 response regulator [Cohnella fermenti]
MDKYTMVVIDDIRTVVNGIAAEMDWSREGIEIVGAASNGEAGLELIRDKKPDLIVTDIRMPRLNGIEMIRALQALDLHGKVIFISGYSDFEYTRSAIKMGAFDYVLKPFTPSQLREVVLKARDAIAEERDQLRRRSDMERKLLESMPLLRQEYLGVLIRFASSPAAIDKRWDFLDIRLDRERLDVLVFEIDRFEDWTRSLPIGEIELLRFAVQNVLEETVQNATKGLVFRDGLGRFVALANAVPELDMTALAERCCRHVERYAKCTVSSGVSMTAVSPAELPGAYRQAMEALSYTFYTEGGSVFAYGDLGPSGETVVRCSSEDEKELNYCVRSGNIDKARLVLDSLFTAWSYSRGKPSPEQTVRVLRGLAEGIVDTAAETADEQAAAEWRKREGAPLTEPQTSIGAMREGLYALTERACGFVNSRHQASAQTTIAETMRHIRETLSVNQSVQDYAKRAHLSASYFANLFKKLTGMSVMQFVTQERIEKAKQLLAEGRTVTETASLLGYEERSYFSDVFKKHSGMTPTEFRMRYADKEPQA